MSRKEAVVLASRSLAMFVTIWALTEVSYLPGALHSFLRYSNRIADSSATKQYWHHYHLIALGFLVTRIVGYSLTARWLFKAGPEVEELLLPAVEEAPAQH